MMYKTILLMSLLITAYQLSAQTSNDTKADAKQSEELLDESAYELLDEVSQPPAEASSITVIIEKKQTIEEYRQNGELVLIKVIPNDGIPYFIDPLERENLNGFGRDIINSGVKPVRWVVKEF